MSTPPHEFVCKDCGVNVVSFTELAANNQDYCAECRWLRTIKDPKAREELRKFLKSKGET